MSKKYLRFIPAILWMSFIFFLSSQQTTGIQGTYTQRFVILKFFHLVEYSVLYIFFFFAYRRHRYSFLATYLFALSDEFHQTFVPGRTGKFVDSLIDIIGMAIGFVIVRILTKIKFTQKYIH